MKQQLIHTDTVIFKLPNYLKVELEKMAADDEISSALFLRNLIKQEIKRRVVDE